VKVCHGARPKDVQPLTHAEHLPREIGVASDLGTTCHAIVPGDRARPENNRPATGNAGLQVSRLTQCVNAGK